MYFYVDYIPIFNRLPLSFKFLQGLWLHLYHNYHYVNSVYSKTPNGYASAGNTCILMLYGGDEVFVMTRKEGRTYGDNETNQTYTTFSGSTLTPYTDIDDTDDFGT